MAAFFAAGLDVLVLSGWVLTHKDNAHVATGAATVRGGSPEEKLRRSAQSGAVGRLLDDLSWRRRMTASTQVTPRLRW